MSVTVCTLEIKAGFDICTKSMTFPESSRVGSSTMFLDGIS